MVKMITALLERNAVLKGNFCAHDNINDIIGEDIKEIQTYVNKNGSMDRSRGLVIDLFQKRSKTCPFDLFDWDSKEVLHKRK